MADPVTLGTVGLGLLGGLFGASQAGSAATPATPTITPAAAPAAAPATAPTTAGKQSFLSNAAAAPPQQNTAQKTLLGS